MVLGSFNPFHIITKLVDWVLFLRRLSGAKCYKKVPDHVRNFLRQFIS